MRQHLVIWSFTAAVLLVAASLAVMRQAVLVDGPGASPSPEEQIQAALDLLEADPSAAEGETQAAIRTAAVPAQQGLVHSAEASYLLALQYQRERNPRGAEAFYKRAIAQRPDWSRPYAGLGRLLGLHALGRAEEAKDALRKAIELDPDWSRPHISLAVLLRVEKQLDEAEEEALTALRLAPDAVASHNNYANLLFRRNEHEKAEQHYRKAIEINPARPKPYYNLACLYCRTDRPGEALEYLDKAFDLDPIFRTQALTDPDLDHLRGDPAFHSLLFGGGAKLQQ